MLWSRAAVVVVWTAAVSLACPSLVQAKDCGSFDVAAQEVRIEVTAYGPLKCQTANRILKDYHHDRGVRRHGGKTKAETYYTLKAWPGWKCGTAAGGGACYRGRKSASWQSYPA